MIGRIEERTRGSCNFFSVTALVVKVGPVNPKGEYDYVIMTDTSSSYLAVHARDPVLFEKNYYDEVRRVWEEGGVRCMYLFIRPTNLCTSASKQ